MTTHYITLEEQARKRPVDRREVERIKAEMLAETRAYQLAELRKANHLTQTQLAETLGVSQTRVSAIEHGDLRHTEMGTLIAYVEALGGQLEVTVTIGENRLLLG